VGHPAVSTPAASVRPVRTSSGGVTAVSSARSSSAAAAESAGGAACTAVCGRSAAPQAGQNAQSGEAAAPQLGQREVLVTEARERPARLCRRPCGDHKNVSPRVHSAVDVVTRAEDRRAWRVAVTREEPDAGPLTQALTAEGLRAEPCPVLVEGPPEDAEPLRRAVAELASYDWLICASARAARSLGETQALPAWPPSLRTAAVGSATAAALAELGATVSVVGDSSGAEGLWRAMASLDAWPGRRVLVLTTPGGRTTLLDALRAAGAETDVVEAYRMTPRPADQIRRDWARAAADAVVLASPRTAATLAGAVGIDALRRLEAIVAIGDTTARAVTGLGLACDVAPEATFGSAARTLARRWSREATS
jgi:uroporphyrinogen-III synthase